MFRCISLATAISMSVAAFAVDVVTTAPGELSTAIGEEPASVTVLKVSGPLDATDFDYIVNNLVSLTSLDLADATIEASSGKRALTEQTTFAANELPAFALFGSPITTVTLPSTITSIGEGAFGASSITTIEIPASVTSIGNNAFSACKSLTTIVIPSTVKSLGNSVFNDCTALETATINAPVTALPEKSFSCCTALTSVTISSVSTLGNEAFKGCTALTGITFPVSLTSIGNHTFYGTGLNSADLTGCTSLASVGDFAFADCEALQSVTFGDTSLQLGEGVFFGDTSLTSVALPSSITIIPAFTFKGTTSINSSELLHDGVTEIGDFALTGWTQVEEFTFPSSVTHIGDNAMEGWTSLTKLTAEELAGVPTLGKEVWEGVEQSMIVLLVRSDSKDAFLAAEQWREFNVRTSTSGADTITLPVGDADSAITFSVANRCLTVTSTTEPIATVAVYDVAGTMRYAGHPEAMICAIPLEQWQSSVVIVQAQLNDGTSAAIKVSIE